MKKVFLIILISLLCVLGALGIAIGGMYLFGGFNEKLVYAEEFHFNKTEVVSAENMYLKIDTTTEGVNKKKLKLIVSMGGERIINFPQTVYIGEPFTIVPKQEKGVNIGGNVTLTAIYDEPNANVNVQAKCNILVDVPVKSVSINLSSNKLTPDQQIFICKKGFPVTDTFKVDPVNSLTPYDKSWPISDAIKENLIDKTMYLELAPNGNVPIDDVAFFVDETGKKYPDKIIQVKYSYDGNNFVFDETICLKAGNISSDAKLNLYVYPTYKAQNNNILGSDIELNKKEALNNITDFVVGSYIIDNMTIFDKDDNYTVNKDVLLDKQIKIYINNPDAKGDDINLNLNLEATNSPSSLIGKLEYKDNVYLKISYPEFITLTKMDGSSDTEQIVGEDRGLNINCENLGDQVSTWYWLLKINDFHAYYNYLKNNIPLTATLGYYGEGTSVANKTFNIVPKINEVGSLTPKYEEGNSFRVKSGETFNIGPNNIVINPATAFAPTYTDLAFYLDFAENSINSKTTISTIPTQAGDYKATFNFKLKQKLEPSKLNNLAISCLPSWATINQEKNVFSYLTQIGQDYLYSGEIYLTIHSTINDDTLFSIDEFSVSISSFMVKFYEQMENSTNFEVIPYLTINGIRYYTDFDFYQDIENTTSNNKYLKINNEYDFGNAFTVSGIGTFIITAQLVYIENKGIEGEEVIYWLGKKTNVNIDVYEQLSSLYVSSYLSDDEYNIEFDNTTYDEDDRKTYYIFITSNEMEALKNYVAYNQVNISYKQYFAGIDTSRYIGIDEINMDAITFSKNFIEVKKNNVVVGYKLSYTINPVNTIEIDGRYLDNIFRVEMCIEVNGEKVYAEFKMKNSNANYLDIKINDKIIKEAVLNYNSSGNNGVSPEKAIELRANYVNGTFTYGDGIENYLRYYFKYNAEDSSGITESLSYGLRVVDESLGISLANLYSFENKFDKEISMGKGGLVFKNFPVVLDEDGNSKGVLVEFTIFSNDADYDFNTHYEYVNNMFIQTLNHNLSASIYFKIFGAEITIEAKNDIDFVGYEGNKVDVFGDSSNTGSIFNINVKSGLGVDMTVNDYSQLFTAIAASSYASFEDVDGKENYSKLVMNKDCLNNNIVSFSFYIGSPADANKIKIKVGEDTTYNFSQNISSAYMIEFINEFSSPSVDNKVVEVTYRKPGGNKDLNEFITLPESLPTFDGITKPIITKSESGNLLSFVTVPSDYSVTLKLALTKVYTDGSSSNYEESFVINVTPRFKENDLTLGVIEEGSEVGSITAGSIDSYAQFSGELEKVKNNIVSVSFIFSDVDNDTFIKAEKHMSGSFTNGELKISSTSLNYDKLVNVKLLLGFIDGGNYIYQKTIKVLGNMTLEFADDYKVINVNEGSGYINLIDESKYKFTENGVENPNHNGFSEALAGFVYNSSTGYNKNSFEFDSNVFEDVTIDYNLYHLRIKYADFEKGSTFNTVIKFKYDVGNYILVFDLVLTINII